MCRVEARVVESCSYLIFFTRPIVLYLPLKVQGQFIYLLGAQIYIPHISWSKISGRAGGWIESAGKWRRLCNRALDLPPGSAGLWSNVWKIRYNLRGAWNFVNGLDQSRRICYLESGVEWSRPIMGRMHGSTMSSVPEHMSQISHYPCKRSPTRHIGSSWKSWLWQLYRSTVCKHVISRQRRLLDTNYTKTLEKAARMSKDKFKRRN